MLSAQCLLAADISTNFWDTYSERVSSLHGYVVEVNEYCIKKEVKDLDLRNYAVIAAVDLLEAHLKLKATPTTPLSEVKKAVKVHVYLAVISERTTAVTSRILAFSKMTADQKQELIDKIDRANKLITKLTADVAEYIHNTAELGL